MFATLKSFGIALIIMASSCSESERDANEAAHLWRLSYPFEVAGHTSQLLGYFEMEHKMASASLAKMSDEGFGATEDEKMLVHESALAYSATSEISAAKAVALRAGMVRKTPMAFMGGPKLGNGFALVCGTYPETGPLVFRLEQDQFPDLWPLLLQLTDMRRQASAAGGRLLSAKARLNNNIAYRVERSTTSGLRK